jgi:preprotein translocase subunit SecA
MFTNMRENIQKDIADRFFRQVANHMTFVESQQKAVDYKLQAQSAGYRVVSHGSGKGKGVERVAAKVGRNDPCPCGSGKKYKHCHGRPDKLADGNGAANKASRKARRKKKSKRRR